MATYPRGSTPAASVSPGEVQCNGDPSAPSTLCYQSDGSNWIPIKSDTGPAITSVNWPLVKGINLVCTAASAISAFDVVTVPCTAATGAAILGDDSYEGSEGCPNGIPWDLIGLVPSGQVVLSNGADALFKSGLGLTWVGLPVPAAGVGSRADDA